MLRNILRLYNVLADYIIIGIGRVYIRSNKMKFSWVKKSIALATLSAILLQPCMYGAEQNAYAAEETTEAEASSTAYSVERLATGYTKVSSGYTAPNYEYKGEAVEFQIDRVIDKAFADILTTEN